jgi:hypothetical protein
LHDRTGPFGRAVGASDNLSIEELPATSDPKGPSLLRLTMSWSTAARMLMRSLNGSTAPPPVVPRPAAPAPSAHSQEFVFFPDAPDAVPPLYRELPAQFHAADFDRPDGPPRLRVHSPVSTVLAKHILSFVGDAQDIARAGVRRVGLNGLTIRILMGTSPARVWMVGTIAATALVIGFIGGSLYLRSTGGTPTDVLRPERLAAPAIATAARVPAPLETSAMRTPFAEPLETSMTSVVSQGRSRLAARSAAESPRDAVPPPLESARLADTEVTTRRSRLPVATPATQRPDLMVVRAIDIEPASARTAAARRGVRGSLLVKSDPQGAAVSINGVVHGRTPLMIRDLGAGSRVVRLDMPGYERWSWAVAVVANKQTPVTVKLQPESRRANGAN